MRFGSAGEERGDYCSLRDVHLAHYFSRADVINHLINMGLVRRTGEVVSEKEWRRAHARQQREEREREKEMHRKRLQEAEEASRRRITEKIRRKESPEEGGVLHFDIVWNYRPVSSTTEGATSSGTPRASDSSSGGQPGVSRHRGPTPDKFLQKGKVRGRQRVVGEPYVASLGPNPSPRYLHILRPTNNCREVWARLCPPQPESSRLPRPAPSSPPHMRLVYAGGGAPCPTPTQLVLRQQPAGSHNVTVFQGTVCVGDEINIISMRRANFPFSVTIYENGVSTGRLSACCEHRYAKGSRLGGRSGHLRVLEITGGEPCLRCQLRVVEKRHKARRRVHYKKTQDIISMDSDHPAYTPPETGSEVSSTGEGSSNGIQEEQASDEPKSSDSDMDSPSPTSSNHLGLPEEQHSPTARRRHISSDSCNGPSDQEVAEVLGVGSMTKEQQGEGTIEEAAVSTPRPAEDIDEGEKNSWEETVSGDDDNQESPPKEPASNNDYEPHPFHQLRASSESDSVQAAATEVPPLLASYSYGSSWEEEEDNDKEEQKEEEEEEDDKEEQKEEDVEEEEETYNDKEEQEEEDVEEEEEEYTRNDKEEQKEEDVEEEEEENSDKAEQEEEDVEEEEEEDNDKEEVEEEGVDNGDEGKEQEKEEEDEEEVEEEEEEEEEKGTVTSDKENENNKDAGGTSEDSDSGRKAEMSHPSPSGRRDTDDEGEGDAEGGDDEAATAATEAKDEEEVEEVEEEGDEDEEDEDLDEDEDEEDSGKRSEENSVEEELNGESDIVSLSISEAGSIKEG